MNTILEKNREGTLEKIQVVTRNDIPAIYSVEQDGQVHTIGELRDFQWHETLKQFLPPNTEFSIGWVKLKEAEVLNTHVHPMQSMMIFYEGSGQLIGDKKQPLAAGDVVVVPAGCQHGFIGGAGGLHGFSIQFGAGIYTDPENSQVTFNDSQFNLAELIIHNNTRLQMFTQKPFFKLIQDGALQNAKKRQVFLDNLQIWVDGNQTLLFTRQATCKDDRFEKTFLQHLYEELGHDKLFEEHNKNIHIKSKDTILEAITSWVSYQMLILDNVEKAAIIHLVIENASDYYHKIASPQLAKYLGEEYFNVHIENDSEHAAMAEKLLQNQSSQTYLRLKDIVDEAWDMLEAMVDRVTYLTEIS